MREKTPAGAVNAERGAMVEDRPHSTASSPALEPLLSIGDVARALSCCRRTVEHLRAAGRFPMPDCHVGRSPRWKRTTLEAWIAEGGSR